MQPLLSRTVDSIELGVLFLQGHNAHKIFLQTTVRILLQICSDDNHGMTITIV